jgi:hypothetical protein
MSTTRTLRERWLRFWFEPVEPLNLGICRALLFGALFFFYLPQDFSSWGEVSDAFWTPIPLFSMLYLPVLSSSVLAALQSVWKVSLALSCLGLLTRASTVCAFVLGLYLCGLPNNFGETHHYDALVVIVLGIMALSRCGDGFSLDRVLRNTRQGSGPSARRPQPSGEYTWPVRAVWLLFALVFFAAGVSKLRHGGLGWIFSDNMAWMLIQAHYGYGVFDPLVPWGLDIAQYWWLYQPLAAATVALELGYPLALVSRRARWVIAPAVFLLQVGIRVVMGPAFYQFMICNLFWVPWDRLVQRFGDARRLSLRERSMPHAEESSRLHVD